MTESLTFPDRLRLIDDRAAAFRAAVAAAPTLDAQVPTCPEWTVFDLAAHIGTRRRFWASIVAAGPSDTPTPGPETTAPRDPAALVDWLAESTRAMLDALREAGPDRGCWSWWRLSQSPLNCGAVARHQLQEIAVHTYDAQLAAGLPASLPTEIAVDGVEDFLHTCSATTAPWPHEPAVVGYDLAEGPSWRVHLSPAGAHVTNAGSGPVDAEVKCTAAELVLWFYGRLPVDGVPIGGDRQIFDRLFAWDPGI